MDTNGTGEIHIVQWKLIKDEARGIAKFVSYLLLQRGYEPGDVLIMTPRRLLGYGIRDAVSDSGIPVRSSYYEETLEEKPAQRAFALLALSSNEDDRVALRWWLGQGSNSSRRDAYQRLRQHCELTGESPAAALEAIDQGDIVLPSVRALLQEYRALKDAISALSTLSLPELVDKLFPEGERTLAPLRDVALSAIQHADNIKEELFDYIRAHVTQPEIQQGNFVRVMSLHKAKGLTSKVAIVTGCIEGLIPRMAALDSPMPIVDQESDLQEQRRLFYVAMTRCTEILVLSSVARMDRSMAKRIGARLSGNAFWANAITSRFIGELGPSSPVARSGADWEAARYLN